MIKDRRAATNALFVACVALLLVPMPLTTLFNPTFSGTGETFAIIRPDIPSSEEISPLGELPGGLITGQVFHWHNGSQENIANVEVTLANLDTGEQRIALTDFSGTYESYTSNWTEIADGHTIQASCEYMGQPYRNSGVYFGVALILHLNVTDVTPPDVPTVQIPAALFGTSPPTAYVNGTAEPGSTVFLLFDGIEEQNATASQDGLYSLLVNVENPRTITLYAEDFWGNKGQETLPFTLHVVGAEGGVVEYPDGNTVLQIPAGALETSTLISIAVSEETNPFDPGLPVYTFSPPGTVFSAPATLRLNYSGQGIDPALEERMAIAYRQDGGEWTNLPATVDTLNETITAQVWHFTDFTYGPATADAYQTGPAFTDPGTQIELLRINIRDNGGGGDVLLALNITANNTSNDRVDNASLWLDDGDGVFNSATDILIAGPTPMADRIEWTGLSTPIANNGEIDLFIVYNISASAWNNDALDCYIAAGDMHLETQGNTTKLDPPGHTKVITTPPPLPYVVYGTTYNTAGMATSGITVNLTNTQTGEHIILLSDADGFYSYNLLDFPGGYNTGDFIAVYGNDTTPRYGYNSGNVDTTFGLELDIHLANGPVASNPDPQNNWIIANPQRFVNLTITDVAGLYGVDPATIALEVKGVNYTVDGVILTYTGNLLKFNTTAAGEEWVSDEWTYVTLWQANDTLGNPCQNAPYAWRFMYSDIALNAPDIRVHKQGDDINITWAGVDNALWYMVYRSTLTNGNGFDFGTPIANVSTSWWIDAGALTNGSNYSYVVRAKNIAGEGPVSNSGFKLRYFLRKTTTAGGDQNYISIPYNFDITAGPFYNTAKALRFATGALSVSRWNQATGAYDTVTAVGTDYALNPGEGYVLVVDSDKWYDLVGSHNNSIQLHLFKTATAGGDQNYITLPY
ncbi:MAG: hypothetical protein QCI38_05685, partial [Candidatus Thermoplasmatota archaeon]|nr:hypothetical protein [Candidatus Thermoplasmatota archaeon]